MILTLLLIFALGPLVLLVFNSLKSPAEIGGNPLGYPDAPGLGELRERLGDRQLLHHHPQLAPSWWRAQ